MKRSEENTYDIVIAGGGLVGAAMACLLADQGLHLALVDKNPFTSDKQAFKQDELKFDPRVSALTAASMQLFRDIGVWQQIEAVRACAYHHMDVWDADGTGSIQFSAEEIGQPSLGAIVENSVILDALYHKLKQQHLLDLVTPFVIKSVQRIQIDGGQCIQLISGDGQKLNARLLIAADGGNSPVRQLTNFKCKEWSYNHQAIVTTVKTKEPHNQTALQRFMKTGPLAFLPLLPSAESHDQHYCSIVWSSVPEKTDSLMKLSDDSFRAELRVAIENRLGDILWCDKRFAFPLSQRHATTYWQDNIVLIGDAAHTIHPLAGQGVNLGLQDARALAQEILHGVAAGRMITDPVLLQRYQRQRRSYNLGMMWLMEGFKHLFAEEALPLRWLRNSGMKNINSLSMVKNQLAKRAMGLDY